MKIARTLLVSSVVALSLGAAAPAATACAGVDCIARCVDDVLDGDGRIACEM